MSKMNFSKYDDMTEEQLRELIFQDSEHPEAELLDVEEIIYICDILVEHDKVNHPERVIDIEAAWEDFVTYYAPEEDREGLRLAHERAKVEREQT